MRATLIRNKSICENKYIVRINQLLEQCTGVEEYGDMTEFYGKRGAKLMTAVQTGNQSVTVMFHGNVRFYD